MSDVLDRLISEHDDFVEQLLRHQEALVRGATAEGAQRIRALEASLSSHIEYEERVLLPIVEEGGTAFRVGVPQYYRDDHAKIRETIADLCVATEQLALAGSAVHREIALLIGREQSFRSLLEHHDEREQKAFFPDLRRLLSAEDIAGLELPS